MQHYKNLDNLEILKDWVNLLHLKVNRSASTQAYHRPRIIQRLLMLTNQKLEIVDEVVTQISFEGGVIGLFDNSSTHDLKNFQSKDLVDLINQRVGAFVTMGGDGSVKGIVRLINNDFPLLKKNEYKFLISSSPTTQLKVEEDYSEFFLNGFEFLGDTKNLKGIKLQKGIYNCTFYYLEFPKQIDYVYCVLSNAVNLVGTSTDIINDLPDLLN
jgi:6-phosphofructokinase